MISTHLNKMEYLIEQSEEDIPENSMTSDNNDTSTEQNNQDMTQDMQSDGMDENLDTDDEIHRIGRAYELKRLYNRLIDIQNHLSIFVEDEFDEIKSIVSRAIEIFDIIIMNYKKYENKIDDIILMYYTFIKEVFEVTKRKYKKYSKNT